MDSNAIMSITHTEYLEVQAKHPPREIRIGDGVLMIDFACMTCRGEGFQTVAERTIYGALWPGKSMTCPECNGKGRRLTSEGEVLMAAMRDWLR